MKKVLDLLVELAVIVPACILLSPVIFIAGMALAVFTYPVLWLIKYMFF